MLQTGLVSLKGVVGNALKDTLALPTFTIGPEEIFSGRILLFDANIFNPKDVYVEYENEDGSKTGTMTLQEWKDRDRRERCIPDEGERTIKVYCIYSSVI